MGLMGNKANGANKAYGPYETDGTYGADGAFGRGPTLLIVFQDFPEPFDV